MDWLSLTATLAAGIAIEVLSCLLLDYLRNRRDSKKARHFRK